MSSAEVIVEVCVGLLWVWGVNGWGRGTGHREVSENGTNKTSNVSSVAGGDHRRSLRRLHTGDRIISLHVGISFTDLQ